MGNTCPLGNLRMASRIITQIYDGILKPTGLKSTQFNLLSMISVLSPNTISHLAEHMAMDRTTLTRNLKPLEREDLVGITPGEDRRTKEVSLTPNGETLLADALDLWEQAQSSIVMELGEKWRRDFLASVSAVVSLSSE